MPDNKIDYAALAKAHGGITVDYDTLAKQSGAVDAPAAAGPIGGAGGGWDESTPVKDLATGVSQGAASTVGNTVSLVSRLLRKIPKVGPAMIPEEGIKALETRTNEVTQPENKMQQIGKTGEQIGEWMLPTGAEEKAGLMASKIPLISRFLAPAAKIGTAAVEGGVRNSMQGGDFKTGAAIGGVGTGIGEAAKAAAPALAEKALGVLGKTKRYGATPGQAVLDETSAVFPRGIEKQAGVKAAALTKELESKVAASTGVASTVPALDVVNNAIAKHTKRNSKEVVDRLNDVRLRLSQDLAGNPIPQNLHPSRVLDLKRGVGDLINGWTKEQKAGVQAVLPKIYRALDGELDRTVPGAEQLNRRISSLIPAEKSARSTAEGRRTLPALMRHSVLPGVGSALGYQQGGGKGALEGAAAGLVLNSPAAQVAAARAIRTPLMMRFAKGSAAVATKQK